MLVRLTVFLLHLRRLFLAVPYQHFEKLPT